MARSVAVPVIALIRKNTMSEESCHVNPLKASTPFPPTIIGEPTADRTYRRRELDCRYLYPAAYLRLFRHLF
jgi:hypothetical protein